jgi:hypothetical protein
MHFDVSAVINIPVMGLISYSVQQLITRSVGFVSYRLNRLIG